MANVLVNKIDFRILSNQGVDEKGKDILKSQTFSKVKVAAAEQAIYDTALAIGTLISGTVVSIDKVASGSFEA